MKVVIVEDSVLISDLLAEVLGRIEGLEVAGIATDGFQAVAMVQKFRPEIVILDISMPNKDGIEVLREIRPLNDLTKIIMFTADSSEAMQTFCLNLGADYYVSKTHLRILLEILRDCVSNYDLSPCGC